jgi:capsular exopolysaccharide synthesis family protein
MNDQSYTSAAAQPEGSGSALHGIARVLRRRWLVVVLALVALPAATMAVTLSKEKEYTASATLLLRPTGAQTLFDSNPVLPTSSDEEREAATQADLATVTAVAVNTSKRLGGTVSAGEIAKNISISSSQSSNVFKINAKNGDPRTAQKVANAYSKEFIDFRAASNKTKLHSIARSLDSRLTDIRTTLADLRNELTNASSARAQAIRAEIGTLRDQQDAILQRQSELSSTAAVETGDIEFVERAALPGSPSAPKPLRNLALSLALGLVLGVALAGLFDLLDRRIKDPKEVEEIFGRPVVGAIPESRSVASAGGKARALTPSDKEAFRMLRATLQYFNVSRPMKSVVVTSAAPSEGKTTISWNLAAAAASAGSRVLLLEAELRKPSFVTKFNMRAPHGLTDILAHGVSPANVTYQLPLGDGMGGGEAAAVLDVIPAGPRVPNPSDLLESARMHNLISELEDLYDFIVIDVPPASVVSDAIPLVSRASGVLVVVRLGITRRDGAAHLNDRLTHLGAPVLGVVLNSIDASDGYYGVVQGYASHYASNGRAASRQPAAVR